MDAIGRPPPLPDTLIFEMGCPRSLSAADGETAIAMLRKYGHQATRDVYVALNEERKKRGLPSWPMFGDHAPRTAPVIEDSIVEQLASVGYRLAEDQPIDAPGSEPSWRVRFEHDVLDDVVAEAFDTTSCLAICWHLALQNKPRIQLV